MAKLMISIGPKADNKKMMRGIENEESDNESSETPDEMEVQCWADTLMRAEEIKNDPQKMKHVQPLLKKKLKTISSLADLRQVAKEKGMEEYD